MRKMFLMLLLATGTLSACGDAGSPVSQTTKTFKITCWSADKEIIKVDGVSAVGFTTTGFRYTYHDKTSYVQGTCALEEK